jgi:hypothetical protein
MLCEMLTLWLSKFSDKRYLKYIEKCIHSLIQTVLHCGYIAVKIQHEHECCMKCWHIEFQGSLTKCSWNTLKNPLSPYELCSVPVWLKLEVWVCIACWHTGFHVCLSSGSWSLWENPIIASCIQASIMDQYVWKLDIQVGVGWYARTLSFKAVKLKILYANSCTLSLKVACQSVHKVNEKNRL